MPLPPICSIVSVYEATSPRLSATTRCVVERPSVFPTGRPSGLVIVRHEGS
jgi:hypothetical protein